MKTKLLLALALSLLSADAYAISRYNSQSLSCGETRAIVRSEGAVILRYRSPRNNPLFDRYVAHRGFCEIDEYAKAAWVPTTDTPSCPVYRCAPIEYDDFPFHED
jgi:hypothetical protein